MSREAVTAFLRDAVKDPDLQRELAALAASHGYDFTPDELTDQELSTASGGLTMPGDFAAKKKPAKK